MTFDKWVSSNLGKKIDYDGVSGVQCVDLIKHYVKNVLGVMPQSIGNAIEYYNKRKTSSYLTSNFVWHSKTSSFAPQKGDIAVFKTPSGNGHVSVATGEVATSYFYSYDQNWATSGQGMTKTKHTYMGTSTLLGVLRPKNQANIATGATDTSAPSYKAGNVYVLQVDKLNVRKGAGTSYSKVTYANLTSNAKANAYTTGQLKKGAKITCKAVKTVGSDIWLQIPSGWIAAFYGKKIYIK
ncbi:MAG: CHAP domain-containing protein [Clostridiales bacterium]|nr:CHAP domain-containing protein [Clostridiales bacterium]